MCMGLLGLGLVVCVLWLYYMQLVLVSVSQGCVVCDGCGQFQFYGVLVVGSYVGVVDGGCGGGGGVVVVVVCYVFIMYVV